MACACFEPGAPLSWKLWPGRYRPPLGRPYRGLCRAKPGEEFEPDGNLLTTACNIGYARAACSRVPASAPDAVRLSLKSRGEVRWSLERGHYPVAGGMVGRGVPTGQGAVLDRQVEAYLRSCEDAEEPFGLLGD